MPFKLWVCRDCGHEILADRKPSPIHWSDGHKCVFSIKDIKLEGETIQTWVNGIMTGRVSREEAEKMVKQGWKIVTLLMITFDSKGGEGDGQT